MVATTLLGLAWAVLVPAFNAPDENAHFAYLQAIAERFDLPGDPARPIFSEEHFRGSDAVNSDQVAAQPGVKPEWSPIIEQRWLDEQGALKRDDGGGPTPAALNPPAAYLWAALGYRATESGDLFDHLLGARIAGLLWLPITVLGVWLLAGELFGRRRLAQFVAASVPALLPMVAFVSSSITPDGMLYATWSLALWLGVRVLRRGADLPHLAALAAAVGLACVVKTSSFALMPGLAFVLAVCAWRSRPWRVAPLARLGAVAAVPLALTIGLWYAIARGLDRQAAAQLTGAAGPGTNWGEFLSYVVQFYVPKPPFLTDYAFTTEGLPLFQVWIKQSWAAFGWLEIRFGDTLYRLLAILTGLIGLAALARLWIVRRGIDWAVAAFLVLAAGSLLAGLHWTDYHQTEAGSKGFMQARYLFPLIGLAGAGLAAALDLLPRRLRGVAAGVAVGGLLLFHVLSLGLTLERFYA
jgi:4-amino-4-deoxy-L-arabinose transferase-like glycosyltransferase